MSDPVIAQKAPYAVTLTAGEKYFFCTCGRSQKQPWCDGAHKGSGMAPHIFTAEADGEAYLCGCKATRTKPFCDGSHNDL